MRSPVMGGRYTQTAGQTMDFKSGNDTAMALDLDTQDTVEEPTTKTKAVAMAVAMAAAVVVAGGVVMLPT